MQILIAEDERNMAELLRRGLTEEDHNVAVAINGLDALGMAQAYSFDVIVLDVMLPGIDGFTVAKRLREASNRTPILFLTARDTVADLVRGLDLGGDDYLTKPFDFEELLARLRAVARRAPIPQPVQLTVGDLVLDPATREVARQGQRIALTPKEYRLLELLMRRAGQVVPRDEILSAVWGFESDIEANTMEAFVRLLRNKIDAGHERKLIHTVRGVGYSLKAGMP